MKYMITKHIEKLLHDKKVHKRYLAVFLCMAAVVVLGTVMLLRYSGIAMTHKEKILSCDYKAHEHEEGCYVMKDGEKVLNCGYADYVVHVHNDDCYDAEGNLVCTLPEIKEHKHDDSCYEEERVLTCSQQATEGHHHTDACYKQEQGGLICGFEEHAHTEDCYGEDGSLTCGKGEHVHSAECYEYTSVLACGMEENEGGHTHDDSCYETQKTLICQEPEIELHTHDENCYDEDENLICGKIQVESHVHSGDCFEIIEVTDNSQEETGNVDQSGEPQDAENGDQSGEPQDAENGEDTEAGEIYTLNEEGGETGDAADDDQAEETPKPSKAKATRDKSKGPLNVALLYGDEKGQSDYPEGYGYYTHDTMSGFIKLEPNNAGEDLKNVLVTLTIPRQYVEKDSVRIPEFTTNSPVTKWTILPVKEDENNYYISIDFSAYDKTQTLEVPFVLSFLDDIVPDNYTLPVTASVTYKEDDTITNTAEPVVYKPLYKKWGIDKFVNSNKLDAFKKDGAEAVVTSKDENGNPYLDESNYVEFQFIVNNLINDNRGMLDNYRDATSVTLTDTLPHYEDKDGVDRIAVFDEAANPGWELSEDKTTVSKTYTGTESKDVLLQIYNDVLKLRFPDLKFEEVEEEKNGVKNVYEIAELDNKVDLVAIPSNEIEGETRPTAEDPLHFKITTDPSTDGSFTKQAMKGNIYDVENYKTNPYPWRIRLANNGIQPLEHISIEDREIVDEETGEVALSGLHKDLKFVKLESDWKDSLPAKSGTITDAVKKVIAYYTEGPSEEFYIKKSGEPASENGKTVYVEDPDNMVDSLSNFTVEFDKNRVCNGYDIIFYDDFKLLTKEAVSFKAYTVYRDPEHTVVPDGTDKITYENSARSVNIYNNQEGPVYAFLTVEHNYDMLPVTEELYIKKETHENNGEKNNKTGDEFFYYIYLTGSLMTPDQKEYGDIRVVDLLPDEVEYVKTTNGWGEFTNEDGVFVKDDNKPDIIENYHNSGRTALIFHTTYEMLRKRWDEGWNGLLSIKVKIRPDAHTGTIRNHVYAVGDNLEEYDGSTGGTADIYDLDNDGRTDDMIAYSYSEAVIIGSKSIYAEKFIAPADTNNWSKQGLSLKVGMNFDYLLKVRNETSKEHTGLIVYDTLPVNGDRTIIERTDGDSTTTDRGTEFPVRLRGPISPPEGYSVYYTTSPDVNTKSMDEMVSADIWIESPKEWSDVTAFKLVANEGTKLLGESSFQVRIPVCVPNELGEDSMELLKKKEYEDQTSGTKAYLEAINSFGFKTDQATSKKESNTVWARIPFAGFRVKKVDRDNKKIALAGATFMLTKYDSDEFIPQIVASDEKGFLSFRDLTEGTYRLTETVVPDGYQNSNISLTVTITQDPITMEYKVKFEGSEGSKFEGSGTSSDPLLIENVPGYELPKTGGVGVALYMVGGILMAVVASLLMYLRRKRARA